MLLSKIEEVNPQYREDLFEGEEIKGLDVYLEGGDERIGTIDTLLVDEFGRFRFFVVDTGFWIFRKKFLLPIGLCQVDLEKRRVRATGLRDADRIERLPRYEDGFAINEDYEERVRGIYRTPTVEASVPVEASLPLEATRQVEAISPPPHSDSAPVQPIAAVDRNSYAYERDPDLYELNERDHQKLKLYEERLVIEKRRQKAGEVSIRKQVNAETARISVPIEKERVVIERVPVENVDRSVTVDRPFEQQERIHLATYEEAAEIQKQVVVREEVEIRKEVEQVTVEKAELLRREELNIKTERSSEPQQ